MRLLLLIGLMSLLASCVPELEKERVTKQALPERITITRTGVFNGRGIYLISDAKTGKEYIGMDGVYIFNAGKNDQ